MKKVVYAVCFLAFCFLLVGSLLAEETGEIVGKVTDEDGVGLPGVAIKATSPSLQGQRAAVSANDGSFRFPLLPGGTYTLVFELQGFAQLSQESVIVSIGKGTSVHVVMKIATLQEQLIVVAETPLIDKTKADTSFNMKAGELAEAPIQGRTIQEIMSFVPGITGVRHNTNLGTSSSASNYAAGSFRGEGASGNNYLVDGLSKRGSEDNNPGIRVNFDAWDEVQIISDGFSPELGQAYGGIVNIVTKSGGNNFHGELGTLIWDHRLRADRQPQLSIAVDPESSQYNAFGNVGGPIFKDKIWFFISNNYFHTANDGEPSSVGWLQIPAGKQRTNTDNIFGKLTYALFQNHSLSFSVTYDKFLNQSGGFGLPELYNKLDYKDYAFRLNYKGIFGSNTLVEAAIGRSSHKLSNGPLSDNLDDPAIQYDDISQWVNNLQGAVIDRDRRTDFTARFTQYINTGSFGNHELGLGFLYYYIWRGQLVDHSGKDYDLWDDPNAWGDTFWSGGTQMDFLEPGVPYQIWEYRNEDFHNTGRGVGVYLKDRVTFGNVTLMLGVRSETQRLRNDVNALLFNWGLEDFISPRFSLAWDITGDGVNVFKVGVGNFTDTMLFDLLPYFTKGGGSTFRVWRWIGPVPTFQGDEAALKNTANWEYFFSSGTPESWENQEYAIRIGKDVHPDRMTKVVAEFDRRIGLNWAAKIRGVYTKHSNMLEDLGIFTYTDVYWELQNWDQKRRSYLGLEVEIQGSISDKFFLNGSYVWSSAKGSTLGAFEAFSNYSVQAYNTVGIFGDHASGPADSPYAFLATILAGLGGLDYGDEGWYGPLQDSCDHVVKLLGTWMGPSGLIVSGSFQWYDGYHWSIQGFNEAYGDYNTFPYGRGTEKYPAHAYVDLSVQKEFVLAAGTSLSLRVNINNLFNSQQIVAYANGEGSAIFGQVWGRQFPRWIQFQASFRF